MRAHIFSIALGLLLVGFPALRAGEDDKTKNKHPVAKKIDVKLPGNFRQRGSVTKPTVIKSADDLAKAFPKNEDVVKTIQKAVDFDKQEVLYFAWAGSGQDKLGFKVTSEEKAGKVVFEYQPGLTRDLRPHNHVFAIRKGADWKVERKPFRRGGGRN